MYTCKETVTWYFNITYSYILTRSEYEIIYSADFLHVRVLTHNKSEVQKHTSHINLNKKMRKRKIVFFFLNICGYNTRVYIRARI